mmetsp:Transcript_28896/g.77856  ORF Transcript_28896/g.77856 Transcript_28896/m.77856 type:complete len:84 (-) Transcript_28896:1614-1865(-)
MKGGTVSVALVDNVCAWMQLMHVECAWMHFVHVECAWMHLVHVHQANSLACAFSHPHLEVNENSCLLISSNVPAQQRPIGAVH